MARTKQTARKATGGKPPKRKRADEESDSASDEGNGDERQSKKVLRSAQPAQATYDKTIADASPQDLSEKFTESIRNFRGDLSTIELEDQSFPPTTFRDTRDFDETRVVKNISTFLESITPDASEGLRQPAEEVGSPHTIIVTASAIRAQAVLAEVRKYGSKENKIAKLFAKHMKLKDHIQYVNSTRFGIGAGSPARIEELVKQDVLKLNDLRSIVIDASYVDNKQRTILTDRDAFICTLSLLNLEKLKLRLVSGKTQLVVF